MGSLRDVGGGLAGPPRDDGGVGQQQRHDDARAVVGEGAVEAQHDDLARPGVPAEADLGVEAVLAAAVAGDDDDDAAGVLPARLVGDLDGLARLGVLDDDDERQHPPERQRADLVAQAHQGLADPGGRGVGQVADHGILHVRPSRSSIRSAEGGPHVPAGYCSGLPPLAQWP